MINVDFLENLVCPALESGEFTQGLYSLKQADGSVCCLGAMEEVAIRHGLVEDRWSRKTVALTSMDQKTGQTHEHQAYVIAGRNPNQIDGVRGLSGAMQRLTGLGSGGEFQVPDGYKYTYEIDDKTSENLWTFNDLDRKDLVKIAGAIRAACAYVRGHQ